MIPGIGGTAIVAFAYQVFRDAVRSGYLLASTRLGTVVLVCLLLLQGWFTLGPEPTPLTGARLTVAEKAVAQAAEKIPYEPALNTVAVLPFGRDNTLYITDNLRRLIAESGRYTVADKGAMTRLRQKLNLMPAQVATRDAALKAGRSLGADAVVFGTIPEHIQDGESASITMNVEMARVSDGSTLAAFTVREAMGKSLLSPEFVGAEVKQKSLAGRLVLWAMLCAALPVLFAPVIRRVTARDSNALNLLMLCGFVFANVILALLIVGVQLETTLGAIILVLVLALATAYNYAICTRIDDLAR